MPEETKKKIAAALTGKKKSREAIEKRVLTMKTKKALSESSE